MQVLFKRNQSPRYAAFVVGGRVLSLLERQVLVKPLAFAMVLRGCLSALPSGCKGWGEEELDNSPRFILIYGRKQAHYFTFLQRDSY